MYQAKSNLEKERSRMLTTLWIRFKAEGRARNRKNQRTIGDLHVHSSATQAEIAESELFGNQLLKPIEKSVNKLISDLDADQIQITKEYLAFYHVADGSLKVEVQLVENNKPVIQLVPCWQISDDYLSNPLLKSIKRIWGMSNMSRPKSEKVIHLRANGWRQLESVVLPFFRTVDLPTREFEKARKMERLFELYKNPDLKNNYKLFYEYVEIAYFLNIQSGPLGSNSLRTEEEFYKKYVPFINRVFNLNNPNNLV
jgi:hypothetical protein